MNRIYQRRTATYFTGENLKVILTDICRLAGLTLQQGFEVSSLDRTTYQKWHNGTRAPKWRTLQKFEQEIMDYARTTGGQNFPPYFTSRANGFERAIGRF